MVQHGKVYPEIFLILSCQSLWHEPWPSFATPTFPQLPFHVSLLSQHLLSHSLPFLVSRFTFPVSQILALKDPRTFRPRYIESGLQPLDVLRFAFHFSLSDSLTLSPLTTLTPLSRFTFPFHRFLRWKIRGPPDLAILNRAFSPWMFRV